MKFKYYKKLCGYTMQSLSDKTGIPKRTLEDIQKRGDCLVSNALKLAKAFECTLDDLFSDNDTSK